MCVTRSDSNPVSSSSSSSSSSVVVQSTQFYSKGTDFYIRVAHSELAADKKDMKVVIKVPVVVGAVVIAISAFFLWRWMAKRKAMKEKSSLLQREEGTRNISDKQDMKVVIIVPVVVGTIVIAICAFFLWRWMAKCKAADKKDMKVAIIVPVVVGTAAIAISAFFLWRWMAKRKGNLRNCID
ncbi:hypothetical protein QYF36_013089 [Acer negundo]|nr:hypothetical protein QYF36_013089 [Acer negundo]